MIVSSPAAASYDMAAAFMSFQLHDRGIHVVRLWCGRGQRDGSSQPCPRLTATPGRDATPITLALSATDRFTRMPESA
jgi:hypothetical protein